MENEKKNYIRYALYIIGIALLIAGAWYLFSQPSSSRTASEHVETGLDNVDREQQEAAHSIGAIESGITDGQRRTDAITDSIERSQRTAAAIADDNGRVADRIGESEKSVDRIASGADTIATANNAAIDRVAAAEAANERASASLGDAAQLCGQCTELNRQSGEILTRYAAGVQ